MRKSVMWVLGTVATLWLSVWVEAAGDAPALEPGAHNRSFRFGGRERSYVLYLPASADLSGPIPLVLAFHGGLGQAGQMRRFSGLEPVADREGFAVAYPNGVSRGPLGRTRTWNVGTCCGYARRANVDDVGMTRALLDDLSRVLPIDPRRVYATGISNGGMMAYRLACELSDRIAAIAPVAGTLNVNDCRPARPVPILHFHGTADQHVRYDGGRGPKSVSGVPFASVEETIRRWREMDGCAGEGRKEMLPRVRDTETSVTRETWSECRDGAEVVLYTIEGGGHTWPGVPFPKAVEELFGATTLDLSAAETMWEFFRRHPMP